MQSLARVVLFLLLSLNAAVSTYSQTPTKQQLAEVTADKIIHRFYETLDFADVYREFYLNNPNIRKAEVEIVMRNIVRRGRFYLYMIEETANSKCFRGIIASGTKNDSLFTIYDSRTCAE